MVQVISNRAGMSRDTRVSSQSNQPRAPVWKTVLKVVLIVVAVAAAIYLGAKFVYPAVVKFIQGAGAVVTAAGNAAAATGEAAAATVGIGTAAVNAAKHTAEKVTKYIRLADKLGNEPLVMTAAEGIYTGLTRMGDTLTITTESGKLTNPGAVAQFVKNPFVGFLNMVSGVFK